MSFADNIKVITPAVSSILTGTPAIKIGSNYIVGGIGGNFIPAGLVSGTDVSDTTAVSSDVLAGKIFHTSDGSSANGTIATVTPSAPTLSLNQETGLISATALASAGYVATSVTSAATLQLNIKTAETITPSVSSQTIAANQYLTGTQTILGDANLVASNIASGVTIFGVTGTHQGGGGGEEAIAGYFKQEGGVTKFYATGAATGETVSVVKIADTGEVEPDYTDKTLSAVLARTGSSVTLPVGMTSLGTGAFYGYASLKEVSFPSTLTTIAGSVFYNCTGLTSMTLPNTITSIGASVFRGCTKLASITLPSNIKLIGASTFYTCSGLLSINIPSKVTSIGGSAFYGCNHMTSISLPATITAIGAKAFTSCTAITSCTLASGFAGTGLDLSASTNVTSECMVGMFNALATVTTTKTITLGATNLAKLTASDKAIATNKGWTLN